MKKIIAKLKSFKGYIIIFAALFVCFTLSGRKNIDMFSVQYNEDKFYTRYVDDFSYDDTNPYSFGSYTEGAVKAITLRDHALSLSKGKYDIGFLYYGADENTVLKIYSSDYISEDNSGGKILLYKSLSPEENYVKDTLELDQNLNSVYVVIETRSENFKIDYLKLESWDKVYTDISFYCISAVIIALLICVLININYKNVQPAKLKDITISPNNYISALIFVSFCVTVIASIPLLSPRLTLGHDLIFHLARIEGIASGLASGQFPVRIHSVTLNGFGYPNSYFYPELLLYFPAILKLAGVSTITCYKAYIVFINLLTFAFSYIPFKKLFKSRYMGIVLSAIYVLNPYRFICLYFRSAIGEATAITFIPLVIYGIYALILGDREDWVYLTIGATGLIQSHILSTELVAMFCGVLCIIFIATIFKDIKRVLGFIYSGISIVLLNAWFIFPMIGMIIGTHPQVFSRTQSPFNYTKYEFRNFFTAYSLEGIGPHTVGWVALLSIGFYFTYCALTYNKKRDKDVKFQNIIAGSAVFFAIATTSLFPWDKIGKVPVLGKLLDTIQFPYRLMTLVSACSVLVCGYAITLWIKNNSGRKIAGAVVVCVAILNALFLFEGAFLKADSYPNKSYYINNLNNSLSVGQYEYLASTADIDDIVNESPVIKCDNLSFTVSNLNKNGTNISFDYTIDLSAGDNTIVLPLTYIPKYQVKVDNVPVEVSRTEKARVCFDLSKSSGHITVKYQEPIIFRPFEIVSLIALIALPFYKKIGKSADNILVGAFHGKN